MDSNQEDNQYPFGVDPSRFKVDQEDMDKFKHRLLRTKTIASTSSADEEVGGEPSAGRLERVLTTFDLTSLGVGSCLGTGMYVVAGLVAKNVAGPSAVLSFCIAALASILSGVCYGEFGVRVPKTSGSAYMYSYVTVGEFVAFLIGWNLILEYMIGSAAGASALSACFDALVDHKLSRYLEEHIGTVIGKTYPDFLGCAICLLMTAVLALGVKGSVRFNTILNAVNFFVWIFIFVAGMVYADGKNWTVDGFAPYGASGVFSGAATCFYAFIGFDIIATTGEEARSPSRSIPTAIVTSLVICLLGYVTVTMVLTLMVPYYAIHGDSSLIDVFVQRGFGDAKYVVAIGALASLTVSLLGSMFPMPRVIYAMSRDGLLFGFLANINEKTGTPLLATAICGVLAALMSLFVGLAILVELMSIGTLLAYTLVSVSVLILRYQPSLHELPIPMAHRLDPIAESPDHEEAMVDSEDVFMDPNTAKRQMKDDQGLLNGDASKAPPKWYGALPFSSSTIESKLAMLQRHGKMLWLRLGFPSDDSMPNENTAKTTIIFVGLLALSELATCSLLVFAEGELARGAVWVIVLLLVTLVAIVVCMVIILRQPQNNHERKKLRFMAPAVPFLPSAAMFINIYLMLKLPALTWARLGIWICIGLLLYFSYSMWHSNKERKTKSLDKKENEELHPQTTLPTIDSKSVGYEQVVEKPTENGIQPAVKANGIEHKHVAEDQQNPVTSASKSTSPPGAPPSRPPPPRQESIEKYLRRSNSSEDKVLALRSKPDANERHENNRPQNSDQTRYATGRPQNNQQHGPTSGRPQNSGPHERQSGRAPKLGTTYASQQPNATNSQPPSQAHNHVTATDTVTHQPSAHAHNTQQRRRSRKLSDDECDPFAQDDREYRISRQKAPVRQTYDSSMARARPKPQPMADAARAVPLPVNTVKPHSSTQPERLANFDRSY